MSTYPLGSPLVAVADVQAVAEAARVLGSPAPHGDVDGAVEDLAHAENTTPADLVDGLTRLAGLLDLEWTEDTEPSTAR